MHYIPKWTEIAVTGAIIAAGFALFGLAVKYLPIFPAERAPQEDGASPGRRNSCVGPCRRLSQIEDAGRDLLDSLSAKLICLLLLVMTGTFALLGYLNVRLHRQHLEAATLTSAERVSDVIKRSTSYYMLRNDREGCTTRLRPWPTSLAWCGFASSTKRARSATRRTHGRKSDTSWIKERRPVTDATCNRSP